jgi:hypothetical protein
MNKNPVKIFNRSWLQKHISGGVRACIKAHGPITEDWIGSAAKRICNSFQSEVAALTLKTLNDETTIAYITKLEEENRELVKANNKLKKIREDLFSNIALLFTNS